MILDLDDLSQLGGAMPSMIIVDAQLIVLDVLNGQRLPLLTPAPVAKNRPLGQCLPAAMIERLGPLVDKAATASDTQSMVWGEPEPGSQITVTVKQLARRPGRKHTAFLLVFSRSAPAGEPPSEGLAKAEVVEAQLAELNRAQDDIENFFTSTDIPIVYIDREFAVRRSSPRAARLLKLRAHQFGRNIGELEGEAVEQMLTDCRQTVAEGKTLHREINLADGRCFIRQVSPYRTFTKAIDGAIVIFHEITDIKKLSKRAESRERQQGVVAKLSMFALAGADPETLIARASRMIVQVLNVGFACVFKRLNDDNELSLLAHASVREEQPVHEAYESLAKLTLSRGSALMFNQLGNATPDEALAAKAIAGSALLCPINNADSAYGAMVIHSEEDDKFSEDDLNFLLALANIFASALRLRKSQDVLHESEQQFRSLANSISQIAWMADETGYINWFNQRWYDYTGISYTESKGWGWRDLHHPEHMARVIQKYQHCIATGQVWEDEFPLKSKDGEYRWFLSRAQPIRNQQNKVVRWFGTNTDITEKLQQAEALRRSESKLRLAMETSRIGTFDYDIPSGQIEWDQLLIDIWGVPPGVTPTIDMFFDRLHPNDREPTRLAIERSLDPEGSGKYHAVYRVLHPQTQNQRWIDASGQVLFERESPSKMIGMVIDISERKQLESSLRAAVKELQAADQSKNEFLSILGHELRNPLAALLNSLEILSARGTEQSQLKQVMRHSVATMSKLLDDLLDLNRVSQNKIHLQMEPTDLGVVLRNAVDVVRGTCEQKGQRLTLELARPMTVRGDASRLEQIFINIILNASRYTPREGSIAVTAEQSEGQVQVRIRDNGVGIEQELLEKIFDPFFQIKQQGEAAAGLGIGLALSKKLVQLHGGRIQASSEGTGKGAEFTVNFPVCTASAVDQVQNQPEAGNAIRPGLRVLVVEDNQNILATIPVLLEHLGCEVSIAESGREAMAKVESFAPEAMLVDIGLPDISGHEVAEALRGQGYRGLMVAVSGYSHKEMRDQSERVGFDYHLAKPVTLAEIADVLGRAGKTA